MARLLADALVAALVAPVCVSCHAVLDAPTRSPACDSCWRNLPRLTPPLCAVCGEALPAAGVHSRCPLAGSAVTRACALGPYEGVLRDLVHAIKYDHRRSLVPPLASSLRSQASEVLSGADALVPVPLHPWRLWTRGFNQADDLARALACTDLPVWPALRRARSTRPQSALDAARRRENVRDAFRVGGMTPASRRRWSARIQERVLVLVDDVTTTGATLEAAARTLREAGAIEVRAVTLARVAPLPS